MLAVGFLRPFRVSNIAVITSYRTRFPYSGKRDYLQKLVKPEVFNSQVVANVPKFRNSIRFSLMIRLYAQKLRRAGNKMFTVRNLLGCAMLGSMTLSPRYAYCMDGYHLSGDYTHVISSGTSRPVEILSRVISLIYKLLVPSFLFLSVWIHWGKSHPVFLAAKVVLTFLITKPIPSSVWFSVDQLRHQIMREHRFLYIFKTLQAKTVKVEDYTFFCLARVEIKDYKLLLVGVLGSWWILPLPSQNEVSLFDKPWEELISLVLRSRSRVAAGVNFNE